jgi:hypothetical protein
VVVGLYEEALQRRHDRAEVWPHVEICDRHDNQWRIGLVLFTMLPSIKNLI